MASLLFEELNEELQSMCLDPLPVPADLAGWTPQDVQLFFDSEGSQLPALTALPTPEQTPEFEDEELLFGAAVLSPSIDESERTATAALALRSRFRPNPLPPHRRLTSNQLAEQDGKRLPGEWYGLLIPTKFSEVTAEWLTNAFHAAGTLQKGNAVKKILNVHELPLTGFDCAGGAGIKAFFTVEYSQPDVALHTELFVKMPWNFEQNPQYRTLISSVYGDGDGLELSVYVYLEGILPIPIPQYYFGDICRETTQYVLVTEKIAYGGGTILPPCGKYQDKLLGSDAHRYYYALLRALARIAGNDKKGVFDEYSSFGPAPKPMQMTDKIRIRRQQANRSIVASSLNTLDNFVNNIAPQIFNDQVKAEFGRVKESLLQCAPYLYDIQHYVTSDEKYTALGHINLQLDNAFFWERGDGELDCGLLDWYGCSRSPFVGIFQGCLSGAEPEMLAQHDRGFMECFCAEYQKAGGPAIDASELLLQYRCMYVVSIISSIQYIDGDIMKETPVAAWRKIKTADDLQYGGWNTRCRALALVQGLTSLTMRNDFFDAVLSKFS